jgi:hypothetical protein
VNISEEIQRIRNLIAKGAVHTTVQNTDLPPAPDIPLVVGGKLKLSDVPENGLVVTLPYLGFQVSDEVVFNLAGENPEDTFTASWILIGPGEIQLTIPKEKLVKLLNSYALALYFIYRSNENQTSNWKFFDVIA